MSNADQKFLDRVLPALGVVIHGDFLRLPAVLSLLELLKYRETIPAKDTKTVINEILSCKEYVIWCSIADDQLPFGPTLTIRGEGEPGKLTVPWHQIVAIVQLREPFKVTPIGFSPTDKK